MEHKYLCLRADGTSEWVTLRDFTSDFVDDVHKILGIDCFEIAHTCVKDVVLILDESGKLKDRWWERINYAASHLYPGSQLGDPIVGDVILAYQVGEDLVPVPRDVIDFVTEVFNLYVEADYDDSTF